mmetsp:Transcript_17096/g.34615  ORF Transcript_17096/g.34615 Transcript_17096/m.34615 type:complete len:397 (-) Transcript_17096:129-1319(-)
MISGWFGHKANRRDSSKAKKRRTPLPSVFSCCRPMDEGSRGGEKGKVLPSRYAYQFTLRQTLFGEVACAIDTKHNRRVAIKISSKKRRRQVHADGEDPEKEAKMFQTLARNNLSRSPSDSSVDSIMKGEGQLLHTRSWHPNVIRFHGCHENRSNIFTVLEFAPRGELLDHVQNAKNGRLSENEASRIVGQIAQALSFCHENKIAHLDVSPENILLGKRNEVKLCDFGLAKSMDSAGHVIGSIYTGKASYMAPELYAISKTAAREAQKPSDGKLSGESADVYSLGVVMFLCLTGVMPYETPVRRDRRFVLVSGGSRSLRALLQRWKFEMSEKATDLLARMLAADPSVRASIQDVLSHPWIQNSLPSLVTTQPPTPPSTLTATPTPTAMEESIIAAES